MNSFDTYPSQHKLEDISHSHRTIVVGVTAGIAAYKIPQLIRELRACRYTVNVVPTRASLDMVGAVTWEAISANPVYCDVSDNAADVTHVRIGESADLFVIAPATANTIAKLAHGIADNLLTATALVAKCPVVIVPAMHTQMWEHPATQANIATLKNRGVIVLGPECGRLTGSDSGMGRMKEPHDIAAACISILEGNDFFEASEDGSNPHSSDTPSRDSSLSDRKDMQGVRYAISAGGTHEPIDPVRFIGNKSTGMMGVALANEAAQRGAAVTLVGAHLAIDVLASVDPRIHYCSVETACELHEAMNNLAAETDVIIMSAAVADYRPERVASEKLKKTEGTLESLRLVQNPDILSELAHHRRRSNQIVVGFAAETGSVEHTALEYGILKAQRKGADLMIVNQVGDNIGFGNVATSVTILDSAGKCLAAAHGTKPDVAHTIIDTISSVIRGRSASPAATVQEKND